MRQTLISFRSKDTERDGIIAIPQGLRGPFPAAILCHGHPVFGQDMESPMMVALARALDTSGIATLRFNFRTTGSHENASSVGDRDVQAVASALDVVRKWPGLDSKRIALLGYSFGAQAIMVGLQTYKHAKAIALISPPMSSFDNPNATNDRRPKLFLAGDKDRLVKAEALQERIPEFSRSATLEVIPNADHSWRGYEEVAARRIATFLAKSL